MEAGDVAIAPFLKAGLGDRASDLRRLAAPSVRAHGSPAGGLAIGASHLGGEPDLPPGLDWPRFGDIPMSFIAQIALGDLAGTVASAVLPADGWLWFFYDAHQQTYGSDPADRAGWQVSLARGDPGSLQPHPFPDSLPATSRFRPLALTFAEEWTMSLRPDLDLPGLDWSAGERQRYDEVRAAYPDTAALGQNRHRLLGHPDTIQDDMRQQCQLIAHDVTSLQDPRAAALLSGALDWHLLFQVDSDDQAGMQWANTGMLYYWMPTAALAARQFDQAWLVLQSE